MNQFQFLSEQYFRLLTRASLPSQPLTISEIETDLRKRLMTACGEVEASRATLTCSRIALATPVGLNTVGLLVDRLSILCIGNFKRGCRDPAESPAVCEILDALENVRPGLSSTNTKQTRLTANPEPASAFQAALWLLTTNTELWEAQEVLYSRGPESLPDNELRSYIVFFASENVRRNELMQQLATLYWQDEPHTFQ